MSHRKKAAHHDPFNIDDIRAEILSRLPLKSLFKCRTINSSWRATIDSSTFRKLHVENQLSNNDNNYEEDTCFLQFIYSFRFYRDFHALSIMSPEAGKPYGKPYDDFPSYQDFFENNTGATLGFSRPVHGLICLYKRNSVNPIALCNPFLREIKILPPSSSPSPGLLCLIDRSVGLGYDEVGKDYKVVQLSYDAPQDNTIVEVYSRKENTWRVLPVESFRVTMNPIQHVHPSSRKSDTAVHWKGISKYVKQTIIVSFDMHREVFQTIEIPIPLTQYRIGNHNIRYMQPIEIFRKEDSFVMFVGEASDPGGIIIWEYRREWVKIGNLEAFLFPKDGSVWPVATWKRSGFVMRVDSDEKLEFYYYRYDRNGSQKISMKLFEPPPGKNIIMNIVEYKGSFVSP